MADIFARTRVIEGSTADWTLNNLILGDGELAVERQPDATVIRIGDGILPALSCPAIGKNVNAENVFYTPPGLPVTNVASYLDPRHVEYPADHGAVGDGVHDDTTAMVNFFNAAIANGRGHIPAGDYLVDGGALAFNTPFLNAAWPTITTDGHENVRFLRRNATDAPLMSITNGVATSGVFRGWRGGALGGITFVQNGQATGANQHGLVLRGIWGTQFGHMEMDDMGGSALAILRVLYLGNNPDPYNVTFCSFEAVEGNRSGRYALENANGVGFTGCIIKYFRAIENTLGGYYGVGAGIFIDVASLGSNRGWAFSDGGETENLGVLGRCVVNMAEIDNSEYGIRLNRSSYLTFHKVRFVHRFQFGINTTAIYWPREAINLGTGSLSTSLQNITIECQHRIEAGGTKPDLGLFFNATNDPNISGVAVDQRILDQPGFGFVDTDYYTGVSTSSTLVLTKNGGQRINDQMVKIAAVVRSSAADTVPNAGYPTITAKLNFATELSDRPNYYDTANSWFVVPYTGLYRVHATICLAVAVGTRVRLAFATENGGVVTVARQKIGFQANAAATHYEIDGLVLLTAGHRLFLMADQNTAGAVAMSTPISPTADLTWSVEAA